MGKGLKPTETLNHTAKRGPCSRAHFGSTIAACAIAKRLGFLFGFAHAHRHWSLRRRLHIKTHAFLRRKRRPPSHGDTCLACAFACFTPRLRKYFFQLKKWCAVFVSGSTVQGAHDQTHAIQTLEQVLRHGAERQFATLEEVQGTPHVTMDCGVFTKKRRSQRKRWCVKEKKQGSTTEASK